MFRQVSFCLAQIGLFHLFVVEKLSARAGQGKLAGLQHVGHIGNAQGHVGGRPSPRMPIIIR